MFATRVLRSWRGLRSCSSCAQLEDTRPLAPFRTSLSNPAHHSPLNIGQFYSIHPNVINTHFCLGGFHKLMAQEFEAFNESSLMIRRPALEVISYLKQANYSLPAIRYIIYGRRGVGKTVTLAHIIHYCAANGWFIIHRPLAFSLLHRLPWADRNVNLLHDRQVDFPSEGVIILNSLKRANGALIKQYELATTKEYTWSKREVTPVGTPLLDLVDFGLTRIKYSCDIVGAVMREIRVQASKKGYKLLVAIDSFNTWYGKTTMKRKDVSKVKPSDVTLIKNYKRQVVNDWCGGAVVCVVQDHCVVEEVKENYTPRYLLGKQGFEDVDPFIPVEVEEYSEEEIENQIDYYLDRRWIIEDTIDRPQLKHLSAYNPYLLQQIVKNL